MQYEGFQQSRKCRWASSIFRRSTKVTERETRIKAIRAIHVQWCTSTINEWCQGRKSILLKVFHCQMIVATTVSPGDRSSLTDIVWTNSTCCEFSIDIRHVVHNCLIRCYAHSIFLSIRELKIVISLKHWDWPMIPPWSWFWFSLYSSEAANTGHLLRWSEEKHHHNLKK